MKKQKKEINFKDERGYIQDILTNKTIEHVTYIFAKKDTVRGNHYHKRTTQYTYVLEGKIEYHFIDSSNRQEVEELKAGEIIESPANEKHAVKAVEDTKLMIFTHGPRGGCNYEEDTYRLHKPIVT